MNPSIYEANLPSSKMLKSGGEDSQQQHAVSQAVQTPSRPQRKSKIIKQKPANISDQLDATNVSRPERDDSKVDIKKSKKQTAKAAPSNGKFSSMSVETPDGIKEAKACIQAEQKGKITQAKPKPNGKPFSRQGSKRKPQNATQQ